MTAKKSKSKGPRQVTTLVNGQVTGQTVAETSTIRDAAVSIAREHGLRTFSIKVNGKKVTAEAAAKLLTGAKSIEVYAKDQRG